MKDNLQKLMVAAWEFAKDVIQINAQDIRDWKDIYNLRQMLCDQFDHDSADYRFMRSMTNAVLDWYEDCSKEDKK